MLIFYLKFQCYQQFDDSFHFTTSNQYYKHVAYNHYVLHIFNKHAVNFKNAAIDHKDAWLCFGINDSFIKKLCGLQTF